MVYYILEINDIIKKGDEYFNFDKKIWLEVKDIIGMRIEEYFVPFRRKLLITSPTKPCFNCGYDNQDFMYSRRCPACMEEGV